jgi:hypothetical protein
MFDVDFLGFPRRTCHVLLPASPVRATAAGLVLYDNTRPHQRLVRRLGGALLALRLQRVLRLGRLPAPLLDQEWWEEWCDRVAKPSVGSVGRAAFRFWEDRIAALLMTESGEPLAFAKVWRDPPGPLLRPDPYMQPAVLRCLASDRPRTFRVAAFLAEGTLGGWVYQLFEPLPPGAHRPVAAEPRRLARILDEMRERLSALPRSAGIPSDHVVGHGDFTPRNVREAADGHVWVLDWEYAGWAPVLADELGFWTAQLAWRAWSRPERDGRRVLRLLRERGSEEQIDQALRWTAYMTPEQRAIARVAARDRGLASIGADAWECEQRA